MSVTESIIEQAALDWLKGSGYEVSSDLAIAPCESAAERLDYKQVCSFRPTANQAGGFESMIAQVVLEGAVRGVLLNEALWPQQFEWLRQKLETMHKVFAPIVRTLRSE